MTFQTFPDPAGGPQVNTSQVHTAEFSGSGSEFFRIWIVNVILSILTLGIYLAWAKVRTMQYLHRNTRLAGASFDYHARPIVILKGNLVALALVLAYGALNHFFGTTGFVVSIAIILAVVPWLLNRSLRFRLGVTSYRGLRFAFHGSVAKAYLVFAVWPILTVFTAYLLAPFTHHAIKSYQHNNTSYGSTSFRFTAAIRSFYAIYAVWFVCFAIVVLLPLIVVGVYAYVNAIPGNQATGLILFGMFWLYLGAFVLLPLFTVRLRNLIWNHTKLGPHEIVSRVGLGKTAFIWWTSLVLIICTLGLYTPFARVRWVRYLATSTSLVAVGNLDEFVAGQTAGQVGAVGEGMADMLGIDIAL